MSEERAPYLTGRSASVSLHPSMTLEQVARWCHAHAQQLEIVHSTLRGRCVTYFRPRPADAVEGSEHVSTWYDEAGEIPMFLRPQAE